MYQGLLIFQYISIFILLVELFYIFPQMRTKLQGYLFISVLATLVNNWGYLLEMMSKTSDEYLLTTKVTYLGKVMIPFAMFLFTMEVCKISLPRPLVYIMALIHLVTYTFVLFVEKCPWYYSSVTFYTDGPYVHNEYGHGVWYIGYSAIMLLYGVIGIALLVRSTLKEKEAEAKHRIFYVTLAMAIPLISYVVELIGGIYVYDDTLIGYTIGSVFMCIALFKYDLMDALTLARAYIADELSEAILVTDMCGKIQYSNAPAKALFPSIHENEEEIIAELGEHIDSAEYLSKNNHLYTATVKPLISKGKAYGYIYALIDDTEDVAHANELQKAKDEADIANRAKSDFLSTMSHEIRTPMNAIVGMTEIMLRDDVSDTQRKYLENIQRSGDSLLSIINDILDFSKIEAGKLSIVNEPYNLNLMIDDLNMIFINRIGEKPVTMEYDVDDTIPRMLNGDGLRVRQIIINLVNNAIKFTEQGIVRLEIKKEELSDDKLRLLCSVKDTGQGIKEEDIGKLFGHFEQVDSVKNHSKEGSGLGLAICKRLVELMGGTIGVRSEYGEGSEFFFDIIQSRVTDEELAYLEVSKQRESIFEAPDAHILLVDDNEMNITVALGLMEALKMHIDTATNGREAIEKVARNQYDLILMDHMMPVMDGLEATKKIRSEDDKYHKTIPIIALTANVNPEAKNEFLQVGMNDFIAKPIRMKELCKSLRIWLPDKYINEVGEAACDSSIREPSFEVEGLDIKSAVEIVGSEDMLRTLLADYYRLIDRKSKALEEYLAEGMLHEYTIEVHALKNTSRMIGASELSEKFFKLEKLGDAGKREKLLPLHKETMELFRALKPSLEPFVETDNENKSDIDDRSLNEILVQMRDAAKEFDYDTALQCLKMLRDCKLPKKVSDSMEQFEILMSDVAFEDIIKLCDELI